MPELSISPDTLGFASRHALRALGGLSLALACASWAPALAADWPQFQCSASHPGFNANESRSRRRTSGRCTSRSRPASGATSRTKAARRHLLLNGCSSPASTASSRCSTRLDAARRRAGRSGKARPPATSRAPRRSRAASSRSPPPTTSCTCSPRTAAAAQCAPLWRGEQSSASVDSPVAVADARFFVGDIAGRLSVFSLGGCGQQMCAPLWTAQADPNEKMNSSPAVGEGFVFVQTTISTLATPPAACSSPARGLRPADVRARVDG